MIRGCRNFGARELVEVGTQKQEKKELPNRFNTVPCTLALTSLFVVDPITVTVACHPARTNVLSSGKWVLPHVCTSVALEFATSLVNIQL